MIVKDFRFAAVQKVGFSLLQRKKKTAFVSGTGHRNAPARMQLVDLKRFQNTA